jgi:putative ribosome biogenesis GTPase RsgA
MREYVPNLIERQKWFRPTKRLEVGDEVIIIDENNRRGEWPVGVVIKTLPDNQGVVRKAVVKTKTGEYLRPVIKLCVISESNPQPE